jgi:epoxyqueuosine reductase QueG
MAVPVSYPLDMGAKTNGLIGEVSLRHAALAAGLGNFGRHNLIIHPRLGTRVIFTAVLSELDLPSDPRITEDLCIDCYICVESCPAGALDEEGQTQVMKCLRVSQPYGIGAAMTFWRKFADSPVETQKKMLVSEDFMRIYQAQMIGFQYFCFQCYTSCPIGATNS